MKPSGYVGVYAVNLVWVSFTSYVDTSDVLSSSLWYCCISATSSSVKSTIANGDRPLSAFTKAALFPISDAFQSLFVLTRLHSTDTATR